MLAYRLTCGASRSQIHVIPGHCALTFSRTSSFMPAVKSNDMMLVIYVASMIRSVLALHKLIDNKEQRMWAEKEASKPKVSAGGWWWCWGQGGRSKHKGWAVSNACGAQGRCVAVNSQCLEVGEGQQPSGAVMSAGRVSGNGFHFPWLRTG